MASRFSLQHRAGCCITSTKAQEAASLTSIATSRSKRAEEEKRLLIRIIEMTLCTSPLMQLTAFGSIAAAEQAQSASDGCEMLDSVGPQFQPLARQMVEPVPPKRQNQM